MHPNILICLGQIFGFTSDLAHISYLNSPIIYLRKKAETRMSQLFLIIFYLSFDSALRSIFDNVFSANDLPPIPNEIANATATAPKISKNATLTML